MGPFKHEVDDGLDLRKAAFECMYTLLDTCVDRLDIFEFLTHVQDGLKDHYDIKVRFIEALHLKTKVKGSELSLSVPLIMQRFKTVLSSPLYSRHSVTRHVR